MVDQHRQGVGPAGNFEPRRISDGRTACRLLRKPCEIPEGEGKRGEGRARLFTNLWTAALKCSQQAITGRASGLSASGGSCLGLILFLHHQAGAWVPKWDQVRVGSGYKRPAK